MIWFCFQYVRTILLSCGKIGDKHVPEICWNGRGNLIFSPFFLEAEKYVNIIFSSRTAIIIIVHGCFHYSTVTRNSIALRLVSCRWMKFLTHIIPVLHVGIRIATTAKRLEQVHIANINQLTRRSCNVRWATPAHARACDRITT